MKTEARRWATEDGIEAALVRLASRVWWERRIQAELERINGGGK